MWVLSGNLPHVATSKDGKTFQNQSVGFLFEGNACTFFVKGNPSAVAFAPSTGRVVALVNGGVGGVTAAWTVDGLIWNTVAEASLAGGGAKRLKEISGFVVVRGLV